MTDAPGGAPVVGVLALQGAVAEHRAALERLGCLAPAVKTPEQLAAVDGLVVPGGESTTVTRLIDRFALREPLTRRIAAGLPTWGSCMGAILLCEAADGLANPPLGVLRAVARRNAFGRQAASAEVALPIRGLAGGPFPAIFIRAPRFERLGPGVETLAELDGHAVALRQGAILATSFHPELGVDDRVHALFVETVRAARRR